MDIQLMGPMGMAVTGARAVGHLALRAWGWLVRREFGSLLHAGRYGVRPYGKLHYALKGTDLQAHHLVEKRFADVLGQKVNQMLAVAVTKGEHQALTNAWRARIPYGPAGTGSTTRESVLQAAREIYSEYPAILRALGL